MACATKPIYIKTEIKPCPKPPVIELIPLKHEYLSSKDNLEIALENRSRVDFFLKELYLVIKCYEDQILD